MLRKQFIVLVVLLAGQSVVVAQQQGVRSLISDAVAEYGSGHYPEAYALFRRAHEILPTARTLRGMGMTLFELRRYVEAIHTLNASLEETERALTERQRNHAGTLIERAQLFVARFRFEVTPPGASLSLDGALVSLSDGVLLLDEGEYRLVADCEGCMVHSRVLRAVAGQTRDVVIELVPEPEPEVEPDPETEPESDPEPTPESTLEPTPEPVPEPVGSVAGPATFMGLGVALGLSGLATGLRATNAERELQSECMGDVCPVELRSVRDEARRLARTTDILWAAGGAMLLSGLIWLLVSRRSTSAHAVAACSHEGCMVAFEGAF